MCNISGFLPKITKYTDIIRNLFKTRHPKFLSTIIFLRYVIEAI